MVGNIDSLRLVQGPRALSLSHVCLTVVETSVADSIKVWHLSSLNMPRAPPRSVQSSRLAHSRPNRNAETKVSGELLPPFRLPPPARPDATADG